MGAVSSVPDMLIPQSIPSIPQSIPSIPSIPQSVPPIQKQVTTVPEPVLQFASTPLSNTQPLSILQQPIIINSTPLHFNDNANTPVQQTSMSISPIQLKVEPVSIPLSDVTYGDTSDSRKNTDEQLIIQDKKNVVEQVVMEVGSPTSFTLNYVEEKSIDVDVSRPVYFTSFLCTDSLVRRYKLHTMPYVLLVINSKYKIPLYLNRNPNGYYEFHKRKGPFYASRVSIQLFNHVNEPIVFKNTPMELCHIQFETRID
jgi:hypothetical protein